MVGFQPAASFYRVAKNIIDDTKNSLTTVWSSNKVKTLFESLEGGVDIVITATRPDKSEAVEKTMYYVGATAPYHIWFFLNDNWEDFGTTELSLENYYTEDEVDELLDLKVDKETGKVLIPTTDLAQITTNKMDIANLEEEKQDKLTDSTLSTVDGNTNVSEVNASSKTSKSFTLNTLWTFIKSKITEVYYPVGSVVLNMGTNPSESFGGTWELLATGTKALYLDSTAGTAVSEELPDPQITLGDAGETKLGDASTVMNFFKYTTSGANKWGYSSDSNTQKMEAVKEISAPVTTASNHTHTATIGNSTYSDGGNVRAEGITVCAWKRTA